MINFTLAYDMRVPNLGTPPEKIYSESLDMAAYADEAGVPFTTIMEHHGASDGYLPTPFVMAAAIAARTKRMRLLCAAVLLPLHDPVKIAEQMAVVDLISNGRLDVVFGAGYVLSEFAMFRRSVSERGKALDEGIPIIQRALQGERFVADGREIFVSPRPVQKPYPRIFAGGGVEASAKRGARLGIGLMPMNPALVPLYNEECARLGRKPGPIITGLSWLHVSDTPEKTRKEVEPHLLHYVRSYAEFAEGAASSSPFVGMNTMEDIEKSGIFTIVTPEQCAQLAREAQKFAGYYNISPLIGGLSPKVGWKSLELLVEKVLPMLGHGKKKKAGSAKVATGKRTTKAAKSRKKAKGAKKKTSVKKTKAKAKKIKTKAKAKKIKTKAKAKAKKIKTKAKAKKIKTKTKVKSRKAKPKSKTRKSGTKANRRR